jgi:acyl-CoA synthetase (AMP-forming)/AMP-acid ligase II
MTPEETAEAARDPKLQHRLASAGRETPFSRIEIIDEAGAIAPPGARGEVVIGGGSLMREYYRDPERSEEARGPLGHHTGDIGYKDADGFIYLVDRKNDMIISGGFNVYPGEVEQVVMSHPAVQECVVVGAPHPKWGEMVVAAVELKPGASVAPDALLSFCREQLGGVKAPKRIDILPALPRSAVGKTLRRLVRAPYWEGQATLI